MSDIAHTGCWSSMSTIILARSCRACTRSVSLTFSYESPMIAISLGDPNLFNGWLARMVPFVSAAADDQEISNVAVTNHWMAPMFSVLGT